MAKYVVRFRRPERQAGTLGAEYEADSFDAAIVKLRYARQNATRNCHYWIEENEKPKYLKQVSIDRQRSLQT